MTALAHWVAAARPRTLTAAVAPVAIGTACAHAAGGVAWGPAAAALAGAALIQIGTNFANDVFDAEKGADTAARKGPVRAVAAGLISAAAMRAAMVVTFGLAVAVGSYLVAIGGWPIVAIGVASVAAGVAYTGGPWPLGYHGLGDLFHLAHFTLGWVQPDYFHQLDGEGRYDAYSMFVMGFRNVPILISYLVAVTLLSFHLAHGASSWLQSLGLRHPKYEGVTDKLGPTLGFVLAVGYAAPPLAVVARIIEL